MELQKYTLTELKAMAWERAVLMKKIKDQLVEIHEMIKKLIEEQGSHGINDNTE